MFLNRRRVLMQQLIDNPPQTSAQLDELIAMHMRVSIGLKMVVVLFGVEHEEIEEDRALLKQMWELIEIGLQTDFEGADGPTPLPVIEPVYVPGNMTLH